jgi:hypothetical protein
MPLTLTNGSAIFFIDLQVANKKRTKKRFSASFIKDKKSKRNNKTVGIKVFLTIFA